MIPLRAMGFVDPDPEPAPSTRRWFHGPCLVCGQTKYVYPTGHAPHCTFAPPETLTGDALVDEAFRRFGKWVGRATARAMLMDDDKARDVT
jgi:hypothetical protein